MSLFSGLFDNLKEFLGFWWDEICAHLRRLVSPFALFAIVVFNFLVAFVGWLWWCATTVKNSIADVGPYLLELVVPSASTGLSGSITNYAAVANTVFPLNEAIAFMVAYLGILMQWSFYRTVRTWLPSIAGFSIGKS